MKHLRRIWTFYEAKKIQKGLLSEHTVCLEKFVMELSESLACK